MNGLDLVLAIAAGVISGYLSGATATRQIFKHAVLTVTVTDDKPASQAKTDTH